MRKYTLQRNSFIVTGCLSSGTTLWRSIDARAFALFAFSECLWFGQRSDNLLCARFCLTPPHQVHVTSAPLLFSNFNTQLQAPFDQPSHTTAMYSGYVLLSLAYSSTCLASILPPDSVLQVPSHTLFSATGSRNHTLNAWPAHLPWRMRLSEDLSIDVVGYGEYAPRSRWNAIHDALDTIIRQINEEQGAPDKDIDQFSYIAYFTGVLFMVKDSPDFPFGGDLHLSRRNAVKVLETTKDLFFIYRDDPREFGAQINI